MQANDRTGPDIIGPDLKRCDGSGDPTTLSPTEIIVISAITVTTATRTQRTGDAAVTSAVTATIIITTTTATYATIPLDTAEDRKFTSECGRMIKCSI
ncbi:hypothetical protein Pmani_035928 [Petrolisthes manimaculis]|uniref:Uncharacterized protein n=1 Tax=Petrolisthes manimaculis TaxID=1843537 RepID=A0AAE1TPY0_9EUCA|nr:hypothetical protein Pmani_035928 [Petrolisthes manimaculis]